MADNPSAMGKSEYPTSRPALRDPAKRENIQRMKDWLVIKGATFAKASEDAILRKKFP